MSYTVHNIETGYGDQPYWSLVETFVPSANIEIVIYPKSTRQEPQLDPAYLQRCAQILKNLKNG